MNQEQADPTRAFNAMKASQQRDPSPDWPVRANRLRQLLALVSDHADDMAAAIDADFGGRPTQETQLLELFPTVSGIRHTLRHGRRWMRPKRSMASFWFLPARTELLPRPLGVVGIIVPWNYPLYLAAGPLTDALAAGNHVLLKLSEFTPRFSALFERLVEQYFPAGEVRVINGGVEIAKAFSALPFDHLLFTGSTATGRQVMRAAAENLTPVTLELGGKSPALIAPGARLEHAVQRIIYGKAVNAGQTCIAPDYVLLPSNLQQDFIAQAKTCFAKMYPDFATSGHYAATIHDRHHAHLEKLRDDAVAAGATALPLATPAAQGRRMPPTLLCDVATDAQVMDEEIFGPLLPLVTYDDFEQAVAFIEDRPHPLALYLFDDDAARRRRTLEQLTAGGVTINDTLFHIAQHHLPFGGVGPSGMGAYHGETGFRTFSRMQPVLHQSRLSGTRLLNPPYGRRFRQMLRLLLGRGRER